MMFNTDEELRKVALSITHYVYRNTKLEDYHSKGVIMNNDFYKLIYSIVYRKLNNVRVLHKYIANYTNKLDNKSDLDKLLETVPSDLKLRFLRYMQQLFGGLNYGTQWDAAQICAPIESNISAASYLLGGRFRECCDKNYRLDDKTMCYINKDVHNRIYTLLIGGYFS